MKKIFCIAMFYSFSYTIALAKEEIKFDFVSNSLVYVKSKFNSTIKIIVLDNKGNKLFENYIKPEQTHSFPFEFNESKAKNLSFDITYDKYSYEIDLERIDIARKRLKRQKVRDAYMRAFWTGVDELVTGGFFTDVISGIEYADMIFNGASREEWEEKLKKSTESLALDASTDNRLIKAAIAATFKLAESMEEPDYSSLVSYMGFCLTRLTNNFYRTGLVSDFAILPVKQQFPNLSIDISYPINQRYGEDKVDKAAIYLTGNNDVIPFQASISYYISKSFSVFGQYAKTKIFDVDNNSGLEYLQDSSSISFNMLSLGIRPKPSYVELGFGAAYIHQNISIESSNNLKSSTSKSSFGGFFEPRILVDINKLISLNLGWKVVIFKEDVKTKGLFQMINHYNIGLNYKLFRYKYQFN